MESTRKKINWDDMKVLDRVIEEKATKFYNDYVGEEFLAAMREIKSFVIAGSSVLHLINQDIPYNDVDIYVDKTLFCIIANTSIFDQYYDSKQHRFDDVVYLTINGREVNIINNDINNFDFAILKVTFQCANFRNTDTKFDLSYFDFVDHYDSIMDKRIDRLYSDLRDFNMNNVVRLLKYEKKGFKIDDFLKRIICYEVYSNLTTFTHHNGKVATKESMRELLENYAEEESYKGSNFKELNTQERSNIVKFMCEEMGVN